MRLSDTQKSWNTRRWKRGSRSWLRIAALLAGLSILWPTLAFAFEPATYQSPPLPGGWSGSVTGVDMLPDLGAVVGRYQGRDDRLLIYIQDLHCHYEVQRYIAEMLDVINRRRGLQWIGVEGDSGPVPVSKLRSFPDPLIRESIADYFLRRGYVSGPEYAAVTADTELELIGVESPGLYAANRNAVDQLISFENLGACQDLRDCLEPLKNRLYDKQVAVLDHWRQRYRDGEIGLGRYLDALVAEAERWGLDWRTYAALQQQRQAPGPGPEVDDRTAGELEDLDHALREHMGQSDEARELGRMWRIAEVFEELSSISASPRQVAFFRQHRDQFTSTSLLKFLRRMHERTGRVTLTGFEIRAFETLDAISRQADQFYQLADQRSRALVENTLRLMLRRNERTAVLVAGGFHAEEIEQACRERQLSFVSIRPRLTQSQSANPYYALLQQRRTPLERMLTAKAEFFKPASLFGDPVVLRFMDVVGKIKTMFMRGDQTRFQSGPLKSAYAKTIGSWAENDPSLVANVNALRTSPETRSLTFPMQDLENHSQFGIVVRPASLPAAAPAVESQSLDPREDHVFDILQDSQVLDGPRWLAWTRKVSTMTWQERWHKSSRSLQTWISRAMETGLGKVKRGGEEIIGAVRERVTGPSQAGRSRVFRLLLTGFIVVGSLFIGPWIGGAWAATRVVYTVAKGDWLGKIAERLGVPLADLVKGNALKNPNHIVPGQELSAEVPGLEQVDGAMRHARGTVETLPMPGNEPVGVVSQTGLESHGFAPVTGSEQAVTDTLGLQSTDTPGWWDQANALMQQVLNHLPGDVLPWFAVGGALAVGAFLILRRYLHRIRTWNPPSVLLDSSAEPRDRSGQSGAAGWAAKLVLVAAVAVPSLVMGISPLSLLYGLYLGTAVILLVRIPKGPSADILKQALTLRDTWVTTLISAHLWLVLGWVPSLSALMGFFFSVALLKLTWASLHLVRRYGTNGLERTDEAIVYYDPDRMELVVPDNESAAVSDKKTMVPFYILAHELYAHPMASNLIDGLLRLPVGGRLWRYRSLAAYKAAAQLALERGQRPPPGYYFWHVVLLETLAHALDPFFYPAALVKKGYTNDSYGWIWTVIYLSVLYALFAPAVSIWAAAAGGAFIVALWIANFSHIRNIKRSGKLGFSITDALWSGPTKLTFTSVNVVIKLVYELTKGSWKYYVSARTRKEPQPFSRTVLNAYGTGMSKLVIPLVLKLILGALFAPKVAMIFAASWSIGSGGYVLFDSGPRMYYYLNFLLAMINSRLAVVPGLDRLPFFRRRHADATRLTPETIDTMLGPIFTHLQSIYPGLYPNRPVFRLLSEEKLRYGQGLNTVGEVGKDGSLLLNPDLPKLGYDGQLAALKYLLDVAEGRSYYASTLGEYFSLARIFRRLGQALRTPKVWQARILTATGGILGGIALAVALAGTAATWIPVIIGAAAGNLLLWGLWNVQAPRLETVLTFDGPGTFNKHQLAVQLARQYGYSYINVEYLRRAVVWKAMQAADTPPNSTPQSLADHLAELVSSIQRTRVEPRFNQRTGRLSVRIDYHSAWAGVQHEEVDMETLLQPELKQLIKTMYQVPELRDAFKTHVEENIFRYAARERHVIVVGHRRTAAFRLFEHRAVHSQQYYVTDQQPRESAEPHPDAVLLDMRYLPTREALKIIDRTRTETRPGSKTDQFREILREKGDAWVGLAELDGLQPLGEIFGTDVARVVENEVSELIARELDSRPLRKLNGRTGIRYLQNFGQRGRAAFFMDARHSDKTVGQALDRLRQNVQQSLEGRYALFQVAGGDLEPVQATQMRALVNQMNQKFQDPGLCTLLKDEAFGWRLLVKMDRHDLVSAYRTELRRLDVSDSGLRHGKGALVLEILARTSPLPLSPIRNDGLPATDPVGIGEVSLLPVPTLAIGMSRATSTYPPDLGEQLKERRLSGLLTQRELAEWVAAGIERARVFLGRARINKHKKVVVDSGIKPGRLRATSSRSARIPRKQLSSAVARDLTLDQKRYVQNASLRDEDGYPLYDQEAPWALTFTGLRRMFRERLNYLRFLKNYSPITFVSRAPPRFGETAQAVRLVVMRSGQTLAVDLVPRWAEAVDDVDANGALVLQTVWCLQDPSLLSDWNDVDSEFATLPAKLDALEKRVSDQFGRRVRLGAYVQSRPTEQLGSEDEWSALFREVEYLRTAYPDKTGVTPFDPSFLFHVRHAQREKGVRLARAWLGENISLVSKPTDMPIPRSTERTSIWKKTLLKASMTTALLVVGILLYGVAVAHGALSPAATSWDIPHGLGMAGWPWITAATAFGLWKAWQRSAPGRSWLVERALRGMARFITPLQARIQDKAPRTRRQPTPSIPGLLSGMMMFNPLVTIVGGYIVSTIMGEVYKEYKKEIKTWFGGVPTPVSKTKAVSQPAHGEAKALMQINGNGNSNVNKNGNGDGIGKALVLYSDPEFFGGGLRSGPNAKSLKSIMGRLASNATEALVSAALPGKLGNQVFGSVISVPVALLLQDVVGWLAQSNDHPQPGEMAEPLQIIELPPENGSADLVQGRQQMDGRVIDVEQVAVSTREDLPRAEGARHHNGASKNTGRSGLTTTWCLCLPGLLTPMGDMAVWLAAPLVIYFLWKRLHRTRPSGDSKKTATQAEDRRPFWLEHDRALNLQPQPNVDTGFWRRWLVRSLWVWRGSRLGRWWQRLRRDPRPLGVRVLIAARPAGGSSALITEGLAEATWSALCAMPGTLMLTEGTLATAGFWLTSRRDWIVPYPVPDAVGVAAWPSWQREVTEPAVAGSLAAAAVVRLAKANGRPVLAVTEWAELPPVVRAYLHSHQAGLPAGDPVRDQRNHSRILEAADLAGGQTPDLVIMRGSVWRSRNDTERRAALAHWPSSVWMILDSAGDGPFPAGPEWKTNTWGEWHDALVDDPAAGRVFYDSVRNPAATPDQAWRDLASQQRLRAWYLLDERCRIWWTPGQLPAGNALAANLQGTDVWARLAARRTKTSLPAATGRGERLDPQEAIGWQRLGGQAGWASRLVLLASALWAGWRAMRQASRDADQWLKKRHPVISVPLWFILRQPACWQSVRAMIGVIAGKTEMVAPNIENQRRLDAFKQRLLEAPGLRLLLTLTHTRLDRMDGQLLLLLQYAERIAATGFYLAPGSYLRERIRQDGHFQDFRAVARLADQRLLAPGALIDRLLEDVDRHPGEYLYVARLTRGLFQEMATTELEGQTEYREALTWLLSRLDPARLQTVQVRGDEGRMRPLAVPEFVLSDERLRGQLLLLYDDDVFDAEGVRLRRPERQRFRTVGSAA